MVVVDDGDKGIGGVKREDEAVRLESAVAAVDGRFDPRQ